MKIFSFPFLYISVVFAGFNLYADCQFQHNGSTCRILKEDYYEILHAPSAETTAIYCKGYFGQTHGGEKTKAVRFPYSFLEQQVKLCKQDR